MYDNARSSQENIGEGGGQNGNTPAALASHLACLGRHRGGQRDGGRQRADPHRLEAAQTGGDVDVAVGRQLGPPRTPQVIGHLGPARHLAVGETVILTTPTFYPY